VKGTGSRVGVLLAAVAEGVLDLVQEGAKVELGTDKAVKRFWPWLSGKISETLVRCSIFAR